MGERIESLRRKLPEIAVEAVMVVFAVFAAFGVEEWRDERRLRQFAVVARSAVVTELAENLAEFRRTGPGLDALTAQIDELLRLARSGSVDPADLAAVDLDLRLPRVSTAAWRVAQASDAAPYFDYDWVIRVSRTYELYESYAEVRSRVGADYSRMFAGVDGAAPNPAEIAERLREVFEPLRGTLWMLNQVHRDMQGGLERLAE